MGISNKKCKKVSVHKVLIGISTIIMIITMPYSVKAKKYIMTYLYGQGDYEAMVEGTGNIINEVSPSYFDINENGNLKLNAVDKTMVIEMHSKGIKVVPFLSNHWDRDIGRKALANIENLSEQIKNAVLNHNLDGVNVDIENVTAKDRENYTKLVRLLREKLPLNKSIVVSVAANPYNWNEGWHGSYDYASLAQYADYIMIMAYDEHFEGGEAGPIASYEFVKKSLEYTFKFVPKEKVVLGIPFYGRYWKIGSSYGGKAVSLTQMQEIIEKYNANVTYDETFKSMKAIVKIKNADEKIKIYGEVLDAGEYVFWYENEESIGEKLDLVNTYGIKGVGTWRLGLEEKRLWNIFKSKLFDTKENEISNLPSVIVFEDVSESYWAARSINFIKEKGWIKGKTQTTYAPEDALTRAEFSVILSRILEEKDYKINEDVKDIKYSDINNHWAKESITLMTNTGLFQGYGDRTFRPDASITRAEIAKIICELLKLEGGQINFENNHSNYSDLNEEYWAYQYINDLSQMGILQGYRDETFRPDKIVTRAEIAEILYKIENYLGR